MRIARTAFIVWCLSRRFGLFPIVHELGEPLARNSEPIFTFAEDDELRQLCIISRWLEDKDLVIRDQSDEAHVKETVAADACASTANPSVLNIHGQIMTSHP